MEFAWLSDIHMNFLTNPGVKRKFLDSIRDCKKPLFITGDISDGRKLQLNLTELAEASEYPVYFVTGNHDYYHSSFKKTDALIRRMTKEHSNLVYLTETGITPLSDTCCVIGVDSWYDGKIVPSLCTTELAMNDFNYIEDLSVGSRDFKIKVFQDRASNALDHLKALCEVAAKKYKKIIILSHPVPFGRMDEFKGSSLSPFYVWHEAGAFILDFAERNKEKSFLWLSGHTHILSSFVVDNLSCYSLGAEYNYPNIGAIVSEDFSIDFLKHNRWRAE